MSDSNDWKAAAIESSNRILDMALELNQLKADNEALISTVSEWQGLAERRAHRMIALDGENETLRKDAELGRVAIKYIDRLCDPAGDDHLEKIVDEYVQAFSSAMSKELKD